MLGGGNRKRPLAEVQTGPGNDVVKGGREKRKGEKGERNETGGTSPPFANSLIRPWLLRDRPQSLHVYRGFASGPHWDFLLPDPLPPYPLHNS